MTHAIVSYSALLSNPERGWDARFWTQLPERIALHGSMDAAIQSIEDEIGQGLAAARALRDQAAALQIEARAIEQALPYTRNKRR